MSKAKPGKAKVVKEAVVEKKAGIPSWMWLFTGVVTGLFIAFLYYLASVVPQEGKRIEMPAPGSAAGGKGNETGGASRLTFDFYNILSGPDEAPRSVPSEQSKAGQPKVVEAKKGVAPGSATLPNKPVFLQAGAFQKRGDAQRRRAELLLLGLDVSIKDAVVGEKQWHRIFVGPLSGAEELKRVQRLLDTSKITWVVRQTR